VIPTIAIANPLDYAAEIKDLFVAHGMPSFPDYFDRTYPAAVRSGAMSWLGRDESGRVVMHQACFPRRFRSAQRDVVACLMVNLMVATEYRAVFPALTLLKRVVQDLEARGGVDFLYADPNRPAWMLLQACRFARMGTLQRYVLPVSDRHVVLDGCIRLFHTWLRATNGAGAGAGAGMAARVRGRATLDAADGRRLPRRGALHQPPGRISQHPGLVAHPARPGRAGGPARRCLADSRAGRVGEGKRQGMASGA